jgi:hypothetical protein
MMMMNDDDDGHKPRDGNVCILSVEYVIWHIDVLSVKVRREIIQLLAGPRMIKRPT